MTLSEEDGKLYYQLWMPLLDFVNKKSKVAPKLKKMENASSLDPNEVAKVSDYLWDHVELIDEYLSERGESLSEAHRDIIVRWKYRVKDTFVLERHLKKGSILISSENKVYQSVGVISTWEEMFPSFVLPIIIEATLIPFRDVIISDGLMKSFPVILGTGVKQQCKDIYMDAKRDGTIIRTLPEKEAADDGSSSEAQESGSAGKIIPISQKPKRKQTKLCNRYTLKVYPVGMSRDVYRVILISGNETLDTLCETIMDAFGFIHEHLYEFCMDNRMYSDDRYEYMPEEYGVPSTDVKLDRIGLFKGQNFSLHYDYGDDWMFTIHVQKIEENMSRIKPEVIKWKGEIDQYPDWDDWDWDEE